MKTIIFIIGLSAGLAGQAPAQMNEPGSPAEATNEISSDALATKSGAVYHNFRIEKVDPVGITISYVPNGGGLGMEQVPFNLLPDDWQRRYLGRTNQPVSPSEMANVISSDALVTKLGTVYHKFHIERVDPAGLTISYVLNDGGIGMEKVPFNLLPDDWQWRYRYDPEKAAKFDAEQKRAMVQLRERMIADEKAYRDKRAQEAAVEEAAQKAAEAAATQTTNSPAITDTNLPAPPLPTGGH